MTQYSEIEISPGVFYQFKTNPFDHQFAEWEKSREEIARAIFWEQGTGKSKLTIDTATWLWMKGLIDAVLIVAPNGVHRNWVEQEIPDHLPDAALPALGSFHYQGQRADTKWHQKAVRDIIKHKGFAWFTISYEAFMTPRGKRALIEFFDKRRILYVLDEAHNIKTPSAARTKSILMSAKYAPYRRILTGTPIAQGPVDAYSQIKFLDDRFWGSHSLSTFSEFKTHFCIFRKVWNPNITKQFNEQTQRWERCNGGYAKDIVGYKRLDELHDMLLPVSSRVTKDEVLDLPPKLYTKRYFAMTKEQQKLYKQMKDEFIVWLELGDFDREAEEAIANAPPPEDSCGTCLGKGEVEYEGFFYQCPDCSGPKVGDMFEGSHPVVAGLVLTRLLRLQQISCGYLPTEDDDEPLYVIPGKNPRLEELVELIEGAQHKVIVWARFQLDITLILDELKKRGIRAVRYDGLVNDDQRAEAKALFKGVRPIFHNGQLVSREPIPEEEQAKVFVGNPAAGATGLTLTEAKTVIYYSNSFKLIDRLQSEDRAHRIGQDNPVLYADLIAEGTVDEKIVEALRNKFNVASQITGDRMKEWL